DSKLSLPDALPISMVPTVAHGLVKPSDIFIRKAQTISNRPASRRKIQAMTVSLAWRAGSSRRHAHNGRGRPLSALYLGQGPRQSRFPRRGMPIRAEVMLKSRHLDRKSTRLNSSHVKISYAVFCLKKQQPVADR